MTPVRLGALCWNQYTDWPSLLEAGVRADRLGFARSGRGTTCIRSSAFAEQPVGTPEDVAERIAPFLDLGYRHLIGGFPAPYDESR